MIYENTTKEDDADILDFVENICIIFFCGRKGFIDAQKNAGWLMFI